MRVVIHRGIGGPFAVHSTCCDERGYPLCWCEPHIVKDADERPMDMIHQDVKQSERLSIN